MELPVQMERGLRLRFVVGTIEGPWSGTWVAWANQGKGDVYLAARSVASQIKFSLHQSKECRLALTHAHVTGPNSISPSGDRGAIIWERTENIAPGISRPLALLVPGTELRSVPQPPKKAPLVFVPPAPLGSMTEINVVYTAPDVVTDPWPGAVGSNMSFLAYYEFGAMGRVWFLSRDVVIDPILQARWDEDRRLLRERIGAPPVSQEPGVLRGLLLSQDQGGTRYVAELVLD